MCIRDRSTESALQTLSTDPALWPRILGDPERRFLVRQGPPKPLYNYKFPSDDTGRKFSANYYTRILSNGEQVVRDWLVYSVYFTKLRILLSAVWLVPFQKRVLKVGSTSLKL